MSSRPFKTVPRALLPGLLCGVSAAKAIPQFCNSALDAIRWPSDLVLSTGKFISIMSVHAMHRWALHTEQHQRCRAAVTGTSNQTAAAGKTQARAVATGHLDLEPKTVCALISLGANSRRLIYAWSLCCAAASAGPSHYHHWEQLMPNPN